MIKAILLAAGQSKRLGAENKLLKLYKKKPLINFSLNSLNKSKVNKIIIVLGYQNKEVKKVIRKKKKFIFVTNKNYKKGMASSIKTGLKKVSKQDKGFIIVQSDMPFIKTKDINKICSSIKKRKDLEVEIRELKGSVLVCARIRPRLSFEVEKLITNGGRQPSPTNNDTVVKISTDLNVHPDRQGKTAVENCTGRVKRLM